MTLPATWKFLDRDEWDAFDGEQDFLEDQAREDREALTDLDGSPAEGVLYGVAVSALVWWVLVACFVEVV
jgi:hypothetical protein